MGVKEIARFERDIKDKDIEKAIYTRTFEYRY